MRSITAATLSTALLGAVALGTPAGVAAASRPPLQYVTPQPIIRYDRTYRVTPNTTRTYRLSLSAMSRPTAALTPCWGYDLTGPGLDVAAGNLHIFGWLAAPDRSPIDPSAERRADGWWLPDSVATVGRDELDAGAECRTIDWDTFVSPESGVASPSEARLARQRQRPIRIRHPRRRTKARPANRVDDGSVQVPLAGVRMIPHQRRMEVVVRLVAGPLAGPTTITLHGRVVITR
jgi:hypothetical protein